MTAPWHRREKRMLRPFPISAHALDGCAFAATTGRLLSEEKHYLDQAALIRGVRPRFRLDFNPEVFHAESLRDAESVEISIVARDLGRREYNVIGKWTVDSMPSSVWQTPTTMESFDGIEFKVFAFANASTETQVGHAWRKASVISERTFTVQPKQAGLFPVIPSPLSDGRLWEVHWLNDDLNQPVDEVLELRINEDVYNKLVLLDSSIGGPVLAGTITASVFEAVARKVLAQYEDDAEENTLSGKVKSLLEELTGEPIHTVIERANTDDGFLCHTGQKVVQIVPKIARIPESALQR